MDLRGGCPGSTGPVLCLAKNPAGHDSEAMDTTLPSSPSSMPRARPEHPARSARPRATPLPASQLLVLDARGDSQALDCPAGSELRVLQGRVWISREGHPEDLFLDSGQCIRLPCPARLHLSAERAQPAWVRLTAA